ncbi:hypothetical protein Btru_042437 [Bulinus truncatus]|nr:hypothetical protein Btru_042437 [Bulinus truncatus]
MSGKYHTKTSQRKESERMHSGSVRSDDNSSCSDNLSNASSSKAEEDLHRHASQTNHSSSGHTTEYKRPVGCQSLACNNSNINVLNPSLSVSGGLKAGAGRTQDRHADVVGNDLRKTVNHASQNGSTRTMSSGYVSCPTMTTEDSRDGGRLDTSRPEHRSSVSRHNDKTLRANVPSHTSKSYADSDQKQIRGVPPRLSALDSGQASGETPESRPASVKTTKSRPASGKITESRPASSKQRVYKDNRLNRKLGRAGKPFGSMRYNPQPTAHAFYVDNNYNRRYNRVGKPLGSVPIPLEEKVYRDTPLNRELGRVGLPWGTCKGKKQKELLKKLKEMNLESDFSDDMFSKYEHDASAQNIIVQFLEMTNRKNILRKHLEEGLKTAWDPHQHTSKLMAEKYKGNVIKCQDLDFKQQIGHGSFGKVYMAYWNEGEVLAIKVLKNSGTELIQNDFAKEILVYSQIEHINIVHFIGACNELPHLAIVMEYMDMSLKDAIQQADFLEEEKITIMRDIANGLEYLHSKGIAHCDLKPGNVLLNNIPGAEATDPQMPVIAKLTDFGLSLLKTEPGASSSEKVKNVGTPRYSAPEVLRGVLLNVDQMMKADIYSLGLTLLGLLLEIDPFEELNRSELKKKVGEQGLKPRMNNEHIIEDKLKIFLDKCYSFHSKDRPIAKSCSVFFKRCKKLYVEL